MHLGLLTHKLRIYVGPIVITATLSSSSVILTSFSAQRPQTGNTPSKPPSATRGGASRSSNQHVANLYRPPSALRDYSNSFIVLRSSYTNVLSARRKTPSRPPSATGGGASQSSNLLVANFYRPPSTLCDYSNSFIVLRYTNLLSARRKTGNTPSSLVSGQNLSIILHGPGYVGFRTSMRAARSTETQVLVVSGYQGKDRFCIVVTHPFVMS